jgi:hypothetical protein
MSEFRSGCGCQIHVAQWTTKRKIASVKYCNVHSGKATEAAVLAERKRCAMIAKTYEAAGIGSLEYAIRMIEARIRSGE